MSTFSFPAKVDSCASTHHSFCIDSLRPKRNINEHIAVEREVLLGRLLVRCGVESRDGNVPMCCDETSCSVHKMCCSLLRTAAMPAVQALLTLSFCPQRTRNSNYHINALTWMR